MTASLFALIGLSLAPSDEGLLAEAERQFAEGVSRRSDADAARSHFAKAAEQYDELWQRGHHTAALAKNRGRAHRLAGNLSAAIAALDQGLAVARYDRSLQVDVEDARSAVAYSHDDLAAQCRPRPVGGIGSRMSPLEAFIGAGLFWLIACLGVARFAMTRVPGWLLLSGIALAGLTVLAVLWWQDWQRQKKDEGHLLVILKDDSDLKLGNGDKWPDRLKWKLPRGVEGRELGRRGGWVQVELAGGAAGWLPENRLIRLGQGHAAPGLGQ